MKDDLTVLRERNAELYRELEKARELRTETTVDGPTVRYAYRPAARTEPPSSRHLAYGMTERATYWRLDELESALSHMRMNGAEDDNQISIRSGVMRMALGDTGQTPEGWSFMIPKSPKRVLPWILICAGITVTALLIGLF